ncbi:Predicted arabinose efflux permease, MFS family [Bradyrhizobium canariense]|uniref:Predicted arabinose efflux permease, MFS family n=2 Tax=Bradyrhizobium canariense TaxID=255045 RepID=A0A1H1ZQY9_9BRAD|nr:Predicted arabinose efflux permease, MFS family [Bradyrhizobium canariense]
MGNPEMETSVTTIASDMPRRPEILTGWLTLLLAVSCGLIVANLYYAQPLIGPIGADLGLSPQVAGLIVTVTQLGYGAGLMLIVPLGDLVENRRLVLAATSLGALALLGAAFSSHPLPFLVAGLFTGVGSVAVQILIPYAGHLAPPATRGRAVGNVTSGLLIGVMLSRPSASFITALSSWHVVYFVSAGIMVVLVLVLWQTLPPRVPTARLGYGQLLASMVHIARTNVPLRRRAFYQACLFGAFSLFWTTTPLLLAGPAFHLSQIGIAIFALVGAAGAISAPLAGRVADRGWTRPATAIAMLLTAGGFALTRLVDFGSTLSMVVLAAAAIAIDFGVQANVVLGYRTLFALGAESRSRLNGLYMTTFFLAGAAGSAIGGWAYANGGWTLVSWIGIGLPLAALIYLATEAE